MDAKQLKVYQVSLGKLLNGKKLRYKKHYAYFINRHDTLVLVYDFTFGDSCLVFDVPGGWHNFLINYAIKECTK